MSSASSTEIDSGATAVVRASSRVSTAVTVERVPAGSDSDGVADAQGSRRQPPGVAAAHVGGRAGHPLDGQPQLGGLGLWCGQLDALEVLQQGRPGVPGGVVRAVHDVVAELGGDRDDGQFRAAEPRGHLRQLRFDLAEPALVEVHQVDLVDGGHEVLDTKQFRDAGMPAGLAQHTGAGVHQEHRHVRVGSAGEHVSRVALVAGCVGQDVAAPSRWRRTGRPRRW